MFTGIIKGHFPVVQVHRKPGLISFVVQLPYDLIAGLTTGASVAIDGVCMTVTAVQEDRVSFDAMEETLRKTTVGEIKEGSRVNIERSATMGDEIGGHLLSGHITGMAEIINIDRPENNHIVTFRVPKDWMKYIFQKGFMALDGCSMTIVDVDKGASTFSVHMIPETLRLTTFGWKREGDRVNVEIDSRTQVIVDTVELQQHSPLLYKEGLGEVLRQQSRIKNQELRDTLDTPPSPPLERGGIRLGIVIGEFHKNLADVMLASARGEIENSGHEVAEVIRVPGSYESPLAMQQLLEREDVDAAVLLGYIERGETLHGEVMGHVVHHAMTQLSLKHKKPIGIGIIGPGATREQAEKRKADYAAAAARAAITMVSRLG